MSRKVALITGVTGQDGSYLAELMVDHDLKSYPRNWSETTKSSIPSIIG